MLQPAEVTRGSLVPAIPHSPVAPRPQCPEPYLLLSSCRERRSFRSCRTLSWHSESSSASLCCFPRLWPSSASASRAREQAATSVSCTRASSGDREHGSVTAAPLSQCPLGLSPSPTLGEVVTLEPQAPVFLVQSLVLPAQLQPQLWCLGIDITGQSCGGDRC